MANRRQAKTQITKSAKTTNYPLSATHEHDHFVWRINNKFNWKLVGQLLCVTFLIYAIETISYFYAATWSGNLFDSYDPDYTINLQLPIDKIIPWGSWLFPFYIIWPFIWFFLIPLFIYLSGGKKDYYFYVVNSLIIYVIGTFIYIVFPTTCTPAQFMKFDSAEGLAFDYSTGPFIDQTTNLAFGGIYQLDNNYYHLLQPGDAFYETLFILSRNPNNVWGAMPSYHNYWASLFVFFGIFKGKKIWWRVSMISIGLLITISTLALHQHNVADVVITYTLTFLVLLATKAKKWHLHCEKALNKLFRIRY